MFFVNEIDVLALRGVGDAAGIDARVIHDGLSRASLHTHEAEVAAELYLVVGNVAKLQTPLADEADAFAGACLVRQPYLPRKACYLRAAKDFYGVEGKTVAVVHPARLRTPEFCIKIVRIMGMALGVLPERLRTPDVCAEAVRNSTPALQFVPEALKTPEMCMDAVKQDGLALQAVPERLMTEEMCVTAVLRVPEALRWVPDRLKTEALCQACKATTEGGKSNEV